MWLFLAFLIVPLVEIALFIEVGGWLGLWPTIGIVILTAALGTALVRSQGLAVIGELRRQAEAGRDPTRTLAHGALILASGLLLLTPGFFTDALGFSLLVPGVRDAVISAVGRRVVVHVAGRTGGTAAHRTDDDVIETTYEEVDAPPRDGPSGWTQGNNRRH